MNRPLVGLLLVATAPSLAGADCPTNIREMAPTGFLASATRAVTNPDEPDDQPGFAARVDAAGGLRAIGGAGASGDGSEEGMAVGRDLDGTAAIGGELRGHRGGFDACASADLVDLRAGAAHVAASAQIPLLFTGLTIGFSLDRDVTLPLAARPEYNRAPVSRVAAQFSASFVDFGLRDEAQNRMRVLVMPFAVEQGVARQDALATGAVTTTEIYRRTSRMEAGMVRFVGSDAQGRAGDFGVFTIEVDWTEPLGATTSPVPMVDNAADSMRGFARFSLLSLLHRGLEWGFELDGGVLSPAGPVDCEAARIDCGKGWFRGALRHSWERWSLEGRVERDAFIAADELPAIENRATVSAETHAGTTGATRVIGSAFAADTRGWIDGDGGQRVGLRATLSHALGHGFAGQLDSELVKSNAAQPELASGARLLLSLAWSKQTQR